jgi:hypothetical protein
MRTPYMSKCVCGHVRESHEDIGSDYRECNRPGCSCECFCDRWSDLDDSGWAGG